MNQEPIKRPEPDRPKIVVNIATNTLGGNQNDK